MVIYHKPLTGMTPQELLLTILRGQDGGVCGSEDAPD